MTIVGRTLDAQKSLFASEFGKQLLEVSRNITHPIYWQSDEWGSWNVDGSGTAFLSTLTSTLSLSQQRTSLTGT